MYCTYCGNKLDHLTGQCIHCDAGNEEKIPLNNVKQTYAGFWVRSFAYIFDVFLLIVVLMLLSPLFTINQFQVLGLIVVWVYFAYSESSSKQATLGKRIMKIKVTDASGNRVSFVKASFRHLFKVLFGSFILGFLPIIAFKDKQGLHDMFAGTYVTYQ